MSYQKCPVCEGRGNVPDGFYARQPPLAVTVPQTEPCRACGGRGLLFAISEIPQPPMWPPQWVPHPPAFGPNTTKPPETGDPLPPYAVTTCGAAP